MPLKDIVKKLDKYFTLDEEKLLTKQEKIKALLKKIKNKKKKIEKELKEAETKEETIQLRRKLEAIEELIRKSNELLSD